MGYISINNTGETIFTPAPVKASLDLGTVGSFALDTVVRARQPGRDGNLQSVVVTGDSAPAAGVTITDADGVTTIHYESGVSTVGNVETALAGADLIETQTAGTGATVLTSPADDITATALAGGEDYSPGVILLNSHGVRISAEGKYAGVRSDGTTTTCILAPGTPNTPDGLPVDELVVEGMNFDANGQATCAVATSMSAGPLSVRFVGCTFRGATSACVAVNGGRAVFEDCDFYARPGGKGITVAQASRATIHNCRFHGGGVVVSDDDYLKEVHIDGCRFEMDYWAAPYTETFTGSAITATTLTLSAPPAAAVQLYDVVRVLESRETGITVPQADRIALAALGHVPEVWDRWEGPDGRWTQVTGVDDTYAYIQTPWRRFDRWEPVGAPDTATAFKVTLGRLTSGSSGASVVVERWRKVENEQGDTTDTPTGTPRVDLVQHGGSPRKLDVGSIHYTGGCRRSTIRNTVVRGGWSDMIVVRGRDNLLTGCHVYLGQDMGYTIVPEAEGPVTLMGCSSDQTGTNGVIAHGDGPTVVLGGSFTRSGHVVRSLYGQNLVLVSGTLQVNDTVVRTDGTHFQAGGRASVHVYGLD